MNLITVPSHRCSTQHTGALKNICYMFKQKTEGHLTEILDHGLGSSIRSSSGLGVGNSQAHHVLVRGREGALDPCPKNKVSMCKRKAP